MSDNNKLTQGVHHIGFTVPDLNATKTFFTDTLMFDQIGEVLDYPAVFLSDGNIMLTLWQAQNPAEAVPFDRKNNIGLHHFALQLKNNNGLDKLYSQLQEMSDIEIEFAPEALGESGARHMIVYIPGGIRTEFISTTI